MFRHTLLLLVLALVWSASFMAIKIGVETIPPLTLAAGRVVIAAVVVMAYAYFRGVRLPREARVWVYCLLLGLFGNALPFTLINWGEQHVDSGQAAILMTVMPLLTIVLAHFLGVAAWCRDSERVPGEGRAVVRWPALPFGWRRATYNR